MDKVGQREKAFKNRCVAMQRVLLLCKALSPTAIKSMARDWAKWDSTNRNDGLHYPSPESYAIQYKNWIKMLLAHLAAGRNVEVERWWTKQMNAKVPPADVLLPALPSELLTSATYLVGAPPAPAPAVSWALPSGARKPTCPRASYCNATSVASMAMSSPPSRPGHKVTSPSVP